MRALRDRSPVEAGAASAAPAEPAVSAPAMPEEVDAARKKAKRKAIRKRRLTILAFLSPWLFGFGIFFGYPLIMNLYYSFTNYDLFSSPEWVGLKNYRYLLTEDPQVWPSIRNTLWFIVIAVPLQVIAAFGIALMLARATRGVGIFRTVFYLPALAPPVAATLAFVYLLNPQTGPLNVALSKIGVEGPLWFHSPEWAKPALVLLALWGVGNTMIIFLAAVLDVPRQLYESASIDGASAWQRLRWVTIPSVSPVILFSVVIGMIYGLQYFTQAYVAANVAAGQASQAGSNESTLGYPEQSTLFYPVLFYLRGFRTSSLMGQAAALSILLLIAAAVLTAIIVLNSRRWVHHSGAKA